MRLGIKNLPQNCISCIIFKTKPYCSVVLGIFCSFFGMRSYNCTNHIYILLRLCNYMPARATKLHNLMSKKHPKLHPISHQISKLHSCMDRMSHINFKPHRIKPSCINFQGRMDPIKLNCIIFKTAIAYRKSFHNTKLRDIQS